MSAGCKHRLRCVRADSGFYADKFLSFLEERALPYIVVARLTTYLKSRLYQITQWQALDAIYSVSEFRFKLWNWKMQRRFVVVREQVQIRSTNAKCSMKGRFRSPISEFRF